VSSPLELLELRSRRVAERPPNQDSPFVLCWLRNALRSEDNPAIDAALALANALAKPLVVLQEVGGYPYSSHRLHAFGLQAAPDLARGLEARGLRYALHVTAAGEAPFVCQLAQEAAAVFSDDMPTARTQLKVLSRQTTAPVTAIDTACLVPLRHFPEMLPNPSAFLKQHRPAREPHEQTDLTQLPTVPPFAGDLGANASTHEPAEWLRLIQESGADLHLPPAPVDGSREAGLVRLEQMLREVLPEYDVRRNNPADPASCSQLSPYLHFGILSTREVVRRVRDVEAPSAAKYKFLDELLKWREFFYHQAHHRDDPASYGHVAEWARESLAAHQSDPRPETYTLRELLNGQTDDETWNAAQKAYLYDGWMHNNLRMYWGKQFLKWLPTSKSAYRAACDLNDRLSLDGRDPSTYGNIQYMFGGGKPGYRELPVYGWVTPKSDGALRERPGVAAWLAETAQRRDFELD